MEGGQKLPTGLQIDITGTEGVLRITNESVQDLAHLYAAFARDKAHGTTEATTFADAVTQHHLIDRIQQSSQAFPA